MADAPRAISRSPSRVDKPTPIGKVDDRLEPDAGVGRRRLLRPLLHERAGPRARGHRSIRADYEARAQRLIAGIEAITDPQGRNIGSRAYRPEDIYRTVNGVAPDLIVYFGDLDWRSVGAVGMGRIYTFENDTGPDEANHDWYGIFMRYDPYALRPAPNFERPRRCSIYDVAPTVLTALSVSRCPPT